MQEEVIKITNGKWGSVEEARQEVERAGLEWGRVGGCEDMVFRLQRSRNLQTLSADAVFSVKVGETLINVNHYRDNISSSCSGSIPEM